MTLGDSGFFLSFGVGGSKGGAVVAVSETLMMVVSDGGATYQRNAFDIFSKLVAGRYLLSPRKHCYRKY